jgi:hypothetical protein
MVVKLSGSGSGSRGYLSCYKNVVTAVEEGLDEETWLKY